MLKFAVLLSLVLSLPAMAKKIELAKITNDLDKEIVTFYLHLDQYEKIDSISYVTKDADGRLVKEKDWIYDEVANGGVVLDTRNGYDILKLQLQDGFNRDNGGGISLSYLYNGATGTRRFVNFDVKKQGKNYGLIHSNKLVSKLNVKTNHIRVIGLVGISQIQIIFAE